jgi:hypothetical protein
MIHNSVLQSLTEDEYGMLLSVSEHIYNGMGLQGDAQWVKMLKVDQLRSYLTKIANLTDEGVQVRDSLTMKLSADGF